MARLSPASCIACSAACAAEPGASSGQSVGQRIGSERLSLGLVAKQDRSVRNMGPLPYRPKQLMSRRGRSWHFTWRCSLGPRRKKCGSSPSSTIPSDGWVACCSSGRGLPGCWCGLGRTMFTRGRRGPSPGDTLAVAAGPTSFG